MSKVIVIWIFSLVVTVCGLVVIVKKWLWLTKTKSLGGRIEKRVAGETQFLVEKDGQSERDLKALLVDLLKREKSVHRAYLARIAFGEPKEISVALFLWADTANNHRAMVKLISDAFASMFHASQHMDIMFLSDAQETQLRKCCKAFFDRGEP